MAFKQVTIVQDYLMFHSGFAVEFCSGVNIIIGGNGTGKTTLMKLLNKQQMMKVDMPSFNTDKVEEEDNVIHSSQTSMFYDSSSVVNYVYIPEKDILEHAKGLLPFIEQKETGFSSVYKKVLIAAQDIPTKIQSVMQKSIGQKISNIIGGYVEWAASEGIFYTIKPDGNRIPFLYEASGYKRLGFLGLLVACEQIRGGTVLFWDEPENSLNPELVPLLVDILLELTQNGVQIFIATHDYNLARYFDVRKDKNTPVMFHKLAKNDSGHISCVSSSEYIKIPDNHLESASAELFRAVVADAMEVADDELSA